MSKISTPIVSTPTSLIKHSNRKSANDDDDMDVDATTTSSSKSGATSKKAKATKRKASKEEKDAPHRLNTKKFRFQAEQEATEKKLEIQRKIDKKYKSEKNDKLENARDEKHFPKFFTTGTIKRLYKIIFLNKYRMYYPRDVAAPKKHADGTTTNPKETYLKDDEGTILHDHYGNVMTKERHSDSLCQPAADRLAVAYEEFLTTIIEIARDFTWNTEAHHTLTPEIILLAATRYFETINNRLSHGSVGHFWLEQYTKETTKKVDSFKARNADRDEDSVNQRVKEYNDEQKGKIARMRERLEKTFGPNQAIAIPVKESTEDTTDSSSKRKGQSKSQSQKKK